jgi:hypothetical protein
MEHAWCQDVARDAAVRAAEDNRTRPLPTLGEAIDGMFPKSVSASSAVDHENKGNGMRTERITLEVTHDLDARLSDWIVEVVDESLGLMESVRVVDEPKLAPHANADGEANHAVQAASVGGEPVAWGFATPDGKLVHVSTFEPQPGTATVVPLYRAPPQPRGWLSGDERLALDAAKTIIDGSGRTNIGATIDAILARSSPPEVVLPTVFSISLLGDRLIVEAQVKEALAAAGVAVKELVRE